MNQPLPADKHSVAVWRDYFALCKPKIVALILFTMVVGMLMARLEAVPADIFIFSIIGVGLAAASAAVINHIVDHRIDSMMARTMRRPLPRGKVDLSRAIGFAAVLAVGSVLILVFFVNSLTAFLTMLSLIGYGFIYSLFLKRATPQNIVIGGIAGAAPPVLGWVAVTGSLEPGALLLCLIIFAWTPPHFWALAIYRREDYMRVNIPMLPVTHGVAFTRLHILLYTLILFIVCLLPYITYMSGPVYLVGALLLNGGFLYHVIRMQYDHTDQRARFIFSYSIFYLMGMFAVLLIDHYMPLIMDVMYRLV